jgi:hypothetical protein
MGCTACISDNVYTRMQLPVIWITACQMDTERANHREGVYKTSCNPLSQLEKKRSSPRDDSMMPQ